MNLYSLLLRTLKAIVYCPESSIVVKSNEINDELIVMKTV